MSSDESLSDNQQSEDELVNDSERSAIQNELSSLSFEELQKLKERIGAKVYKEALFGPSKNKKETPKVFKRENKNRPREMSSKKQVPLLAAAEPVKKKEFRDPRFDPLCGEFDKKQFNADYSFISNLRVDDMKAIKAELKETTDPRRQEKLRRLLQRLTEQHRTSKKKKMDEEMSEKKKGVDKEAGPTHYKKKSELRVEALVKQYEDLKKEGSGRIQRHLKRRQQKVKKKSHRAPIADTS